MSVSEIHLVEVEGPELTAVARDLFHEYASAIGVDLEYQNFTAELAGLPAPYQSPGGTLLLVTLGGSIAGCVALKRLDGQTGEMKRLYVRPQYRSEGLGQYLVEAVIQAARQAGYCELRLDTLPAMEAAQRLYQKLGFRKILPYSSSYIPGTCFYGLTL